MYTFIIMYNNCNNNVKQKEKKKKKNVGNHNKINKANYIIFLNNKFQINF